MTDIVSKAKRSQMMSKVRSKDTQIEMKIRCRLWKDKYRYRIHYGKFKIDIAFPKRKVAVFLDSCFWHFCPIHGSIPKTRFSFWKTKLEGNQDRDLIVTNALTTEGWLVLRFWGHEIQGNRDDVVRKIEEAVSSVTLGHSTS